MYVAQGLSESGSMERVFEVKGRGELPVARSQLIILGNRGKVGSGEKPLAIIDMVKYFTRTTQETREERLNTHGS